MWHRKQQQHHQKKAQFHINILFKSMQIVLKNVLL